MRLVRARLHCEEVTETIWDWLWIVPMAVDTVRLYSWWWACVPPETCRVDLQRNKTSLHIVTYVGYSIECISELPNLASGSYRVPIDRDYNDYLKYRSPNPPHLLELSCNNIILFSIHLQRPYQDSYRLCRNKIVNSCTFLKKKKQEHVTLFLVPRNLRFGSTFTVTLDSWWDKSL